MNVLHIIDSTNIGGIQELILRLHMHDKKNFHCVKAYPGSMEQIMTEQGLVQWDSVPDYLLREKFFDVCVGHTVGGWKYDDTFGWARDYGMKTVEVMHSIAQSPTNPNLVDAFIALDNLALDKNRHMPKAETIYAIVPPELFDASTILGDHIGRISRIVEEKGVWDFIRIVDRFPNEMFVMAGDGAEHSKLLDSYRPNLIMPGWVREFKLFFETLKLFVFPTRDECCCMSVAMAQAAGVPVICQNIPALYETTGGLAWFAGNPGDFTNAIREWLGLRYRNETHFYTDDARAWAWDKFRPEAVTTKWNNLLNKL